MRGSLMIKRKPCLGTLVLKFGTIIYRWHLRKSDLPRYVEIPLVLAIARENEMAKRTS